MKEILMKRIITDNAKQLAFLLQLQRLSFCNQKCFPRKKKWEFESCYKILVYIWSIKFTNGCWMIVWEVVIEIKMEKKTPVKSEYKTSMLYFND